MLDYRALTRADAWREIARRLAEHENASPYLCDIMRELYAPAQHDDGALYYLREGTRAAMCEQIRAHIDYDFTAFAHKSFMAPEHDPPTTGANPHREARCLAALWLAHEADAEDR